MQSAASQIASAVTNARASQPRPMPPNGGAAIPFAAIMDGAAPAEPPNDPPAPRDAPPTPLTSAAPAAAPPAAKPAQKSNNQTSDKASQDVVNSIKQGDTITSITIEEA